MSERENLYAAICAAPRADLPKLVFADWLDEHGDAADRARAELIRIQCEWELDARGNERALEPYWLEPEGELLLDAGKLAKVDPVAGRALALLQRAEELEPIAKVRAQAKFPIIPGASLRYSGRIHGLRTELRVSLKRTWEQRLPDIAKLLPLLDLTFNSAYGSGDGDWLAEAIDGSILGQIRSLTFRKDASPIPLPTLLARPELALLERIALDGDSFGTALFLALSAGEHLGGLEVLDLKQFDSSNAGRMQPGYHPDVIRNLRVLRVGMGGRIQRHAGLPVMLPFAAGARSRLEELVLVQTTDSDECAEVLGRGESVGRELAGLTLSSGELSARGACDLLSSDALPALRQFDVGGNVLGDLVGRRLQMSTSNPKLRSLDVGNAHLTADGIAALTRWPGITGLRKLALSGNTFNHTSLRALTSAAAPHLRTLGLANCGLHGSHIRELVTSPFVRSLWTVDLRGNPLDDAAARALASSPFLDELQCLYLDLPDEDLNLPRLSDRFGDRLRLGR